MKKTILKFLLFILLTFILFSCSEKSEDELVNFENDYSATFIEERAEKDFNLQNDPHSPFNRDPNAKYDNLKIF